MDFLNANATCIDGWMHRRLDASTVGNVVYSGQAGECDPERTQLGSRYLESNGCLRALTAR